MKLMRVINTSPSKLNIIFVYLIYVLKTIVMLICSNNRNYNKKVQNYSLIQI